MSGQLGLQASLAAVHAGKRVLLANKEALVMSGHLFMQAVTQSQAQLLPIDSEHNALFQCLPAGCDTARAELASLGVRSLLLTASGGPFLETPMAQLAAVTPEQACAHPNWDMGRKISVDSATMMNKGLEIIEASWLFRARSEQIAVVIHPQSIVHSLVEYIDGSILAQLGQPDMRTPIAHALAWPQRIESGVSRLDLCQLVNLEFRPPDEQRFPCLRLCREALQAGGTAATILNAANEVAVHAFLQKRIRFTDIAPIVEFTLTEASVCDANDMAVILASDAQARKLAQKQVHEVCLEV